MRFNADGICELDSLTSPDECEAYKAFLRAEYQRHEAESLAAYGYAERLDEVDTAYTHAAAQFYRSAAERHEQDLDGIPKRTAEIEAHKAKLEAACST